jgi:hypothetical protein
MNSTHRNEMVLCIVVAFALVVLPIVTAYRRARDDSDIKKSAHVNPSRWPFHTSRSRTSGDRALHISCRWNASKYAGGSRA